MLSICILSRIKVKYGYIYIFTFIYMIDKVEKNSNGGEYISAHNDPQVSVGYICM